MTAPLVVGIGGSSRAGSSSERMLARSLEHLAAHPIDGVPVDTELIGGAELARLPIYSTEQDGLIPEAERLVDLVSRADAVVIATPGYHGAMSGLIKNALDHLEFLRDAERPYLDGRAVGIIVSAAGWQACGTTLVSVRSTVHALRGWPTPFAATVNTAEPVQLEDGRYTERVDGALSVVAQQVAQFIGWTRR